MSKDFQKSYFDDDTDIILGNKYENDVLPLFLQMYNSCNLHSDDFNSGQSSSDFVLI